MRFRRSCSLLADNFSSVYKLLLYRVVTGVIFFSLVYVILTLGLDFIVKSAEAARLQTLLGEFVTALFSADAAYLKGFQEAFAGAAGDFLALLGEHMGSIVGSVIGVCAVYLLLRFANGLGVFAVADVANDRMSVNARTKFYAAFVRCVGKATLYHLIYVPASFVYDVVSLLACWLFFFYTPFLLGWGAAGVAFSVSLTLLAIVLFQTLKMTLVSSWIPAILNGGGVLSSFKASFRGAGEFWKMFSYYLVAIFLIVAGNAAFAVFTVGSGLLLTVPVSYLFLLCFQLVGYYEQGEKRYFAAGQVVGPGTEDAERV